MMKIGQAEVIERDSRIVGDKTYEFGLVHYGQERVLLMVAGKTMGNDVYKTVPVTDFPAEICAQFAGREDFRCPHSNDEHRDFVERGIMPVQNQAAG